MKHLVGLNVIGALFMSALLGAAPTASSVADAAMKGDVAAVKSLLKEGADVNAARGDGMSALHWAGEKGNAEIAAVLIYAGANTSAVKRPASSNTPRTVSGSAWRNRSYDDSERRSTTWSSTKAMSRNGGRKSLMGAAYPREVTDR